jgi:hypothetical protein
MPEAPQIPLIVATPSVDASFCDFQQPIDLLNFFAANIVADAASLANLISTQVVYSPTEPQGAQRGLLWVKTGPGQPPGVGILVNGSYVLISPVEEDIDFDGVPSNVVVPFLGTEIPEGWVAFNGTTISLPALTGGAQYIRKS